MSRRRSRAELRNISQLDVTPLVDLTFLLLIVFMITAPALENAVDVTPPSLNAGEVKPGDFQVITINQQGDYWIGSKKVDKSLIRGLLQKIRQTKPSTEIYIRGDEKRQYGEIMSLMKLAKECGFEHVFLVTREES